METAIPKSDISRENILARVKSALGRADDSSNSLAQVDAARLTEKFRELTENPPAANPVGVSAAMDEAKLVEVFSRVAKASNAKVDVLASIVDLPSWLAEKRDDIDVPIYRQKTPLLDSVDWQSERDLLCTTAYTLTGQWGIVEANCAIAETGSVVLFSSETHPVAAGFLPDKLAVVVDIKNLVAALEDIWPLVSEQRTEKCLSKTPRALNIITGPSRTADVEQKVQLGAHGPRELHVAIIDL